MNEWGEVIVTLWEMFENVLFKIHVKNSNCVVLQMKSQVFRKPVNKNIFCLLYTSDAADEQYIV